MREPRRHDRALRLLARLLPREFRERVFEPALSDIHLDEATSGRRRWARTVLAVECLRIGLPQYLWRRNRPTRAALALAVSAIVILIVVARLRYAAQWRAESLSTRTR